MNKLIQQFKEAIKNGGDMEENLKIFAEEVIKREARREKYAHIMSLKGWPCDTDETYRLALLKFDKEGK